MRLSKCDIEHQKITMKRKQRLENGPLRKERFKEPRELSPSVKGQICDFVSREYMPLGPLDWLPKMNPGQVFFLSEAQQIRSSWEVTASGGARAPWSKLSPGDPGHTPSSEGSEAERRQRGRARERRESSRDSGEDWGGGKRKEKWRRKMMQLDQKNCEGIWILGKKNKHSFPVTFTFFPLAHWHPPESWLQWAFKLFQKVRFSFNRAVGLSFLNPGSGRVSKALGAFEMPKIERTAVYSLMTAWGCIFKVQKSESSPKPWFKCSQWQYLQ